MSVSQLRAASFSAAVTLKAAPVKLARLVCGLLVIPDTLLLSPGNRQSVLTFKAPDLRSHRSTFRLVEV